MVNLVNSKGWLKFIGDRKVSDKRDAENYIQRILDTKNFYYNIFELKKNGKAIGIITFLKRDEEKYPDFGFALLPEFENKGYAFEASTSYLKQLEKLNGYQNIIGITLPNNQRSIKLLQKLGFQFSGNYEKGKELLSYYQLKK